MRSISTKIVLGYMVIIFMITVIALFSFLFLNRLSSPIDRIIAEKVQNVNVAEYMIQNMLQLEIVQYDLIKNPNDQSLMVSFNLYKNEFYNWHQKAVEGVSETMDIVTLDSIMNLFRTYLEISSDMHRQMQSGLTSGLASSFHYQKILPVVKKLESKLTAIIQENKKAIEDLRADARNISHRAEVIILILSVSIVVFSIMASFYFTRKIVMPIKQTITTVKKISKGQLNQKISIASNDEIADLGHEFNKMTERLYEYEQLNIKQILTEKKKSETIVATIPVAIIVTDPKNRFVLLNDPAESLLGLSGSDWSGKNLDSEEIGPEIRQILSYQPKNSDFEFDPVKSIRTFNCDGRQLFLLVRQVEIMDAVGEVSGIATVIQDVTTFKELEQLKSEFIAIISHQIKTPLTSIMMIVDILLKEVKGAVNQNQRELLQDAKFDTQRLKDFVVDLLQFSRLETGKIKFEMEPVSPDRLRSVIEDAVKSLIPVVNQKKIDISVSVAPGLKSFPADPKQLSMAMGNIIENAVDHVGPKGKIMITAETDAGQILIRITDDGEGIPEEKIQFIFDKFVQVKEFQNNRSGNIGLGLSITREIIKAHDGDIWVQSKVGKGSTFNIRLPLKISV